MYCEQIKVIWTTTKINQLKKIFEFGLHSIVAHFQRNITASSTVTQLASSFFLTSVSLRFTYFVTFSQCKNMTHSTPPKWLLSNPLLSSSSNTEHGTQKWFIHIKQVYFVLKSIEARGTEHISSISAIPAILFQKIKTSCVRMT